tara:strand:- start:24303 stop:24644 length:342 start_codon:yes stop_codon:yes gene_type:complete
MNETKNLMICVSTVASRDDAEAIAATLLDRSLAACVQIEGPIQSHYVWRGQRHADDEYRLVIKTAADLVSALKRALAEIHSYDEPQILFISVSDAATGYCDWVLAQTAAGHRQ